MHLIPRNLILSSALFLLAACGGDTTSNNTTTGGGTTTTTTSVTETASIYAGVTAGDLAYPVGNSAFSVMDANGSPINNLDGGDFEIIAAATDREGHYNAQQLTYPTHVTGGLALMLDISDSMAPYFPEMKAAAQQLVSSAVGMGLYVDVFTFHDTGTVAQIAPRALDATTATNANTAIGALAPQSVITYFYEAIATTVAARLGASVNTISYGHNPTTVPAVTAELMVIMSDALETPGTTGSSSNVTTAKNLQYRILSIPVGADPNTETNLQAISEFYIPVPDGGTLSTAVTDAMTFIGNYYDSFYLVDYQVTDRVSASANYSIKLVGNSGASLNVTYNGASLAGMPDLPPICCEVWAGPGQPVSLSAVTIAPGTSMDFRVVQLWASLLGGTINWSFSNTDGTMTGAVSATDPTIYTVTSTGTAGSATLSVSVAGSGWSSGTIPITVQ